MQERERERGKYRWDGERKIRGSLALKYTIIFVDQNLLFINQVFYNFFIGSKYRKKLTKIKFKKKKFF